MDGEASCQLLSQMTVCIEAPVLGAKLACVVDKDVIHCIGGQLDFWIDHGAYCQSMNSALVIQQTSHLDSHPGWNMLDWSHAPGRRRLAIQAGGVDLVDWITDTRNRV